MEVIWLGGYRKGMEVGGGILVHRRAIDPCMRGDLGPDPERTIPASGAQRHPIGAHSQAAHAVLVTRKHANPFALEGIPDVTRPVIVPAEQYPSRDRECDRSNTTEDVIVCEGIQLPVGS